MYRRFQKTQQAPVWKQKANTTTKTEATEGNKKVFRIKKTVKNGKSKEAMKVLEREEVKY